MAKIKCKQCGSILVSKHINDFVSCGCRNNTFITGGNDAFRYGGLDRSKIEIIEDPRLKSINKPYKNIKHG